MLEVPSYIPRPDYSGITGPNVRENVITLYKDPKDIAAMRETCQLAAHIRAYAGALVKEGVTTDEIDYQTHKEIVSCGAYPSPLGYAGFPKSICTSVNDVICHGIPDDGPLEDGDVVKIDTVVYYNGFHGDNCGSFVVGKPDQALKHLLDTLNQCLAKSIEACGPGTKVSLIGDIIERIVTNSTPRLDVSRDFCGHGVGREIHAPPLVPCHRMLSAPGVMQPGMFFTIGIRHHEKYSI